MTEKRFEFREVNELAMLPKVYDTERQEYANLFECVGWLNEQHETIQGLERYLDSMRCGALTDDKRIKELYEENEQLKSKNRGLQSELQIFKEDVTHSNLQIDKFADENEQLKKEIKAKDKIIELYCEKVVE